MEAASLSGITTYLMPYDLRGLQFQLSAKEYERHDQVPRKKVLTPKQTNLSGIRKCQIETAIWGIARCQELYIMFPKCSISG